MVDLPYVHKTMMGDMFQSMSFPPKAQYRPNSLLTHAINALSTLRKALFKNHKPDGVASKSA
jgi:alpha-ketoglutarate-dependent taurine dioxygenase